MRAPRPRKIANTCGGISNADATTREYLRGMGTDGTPRFRIAIHRAKGCYFALALGLPGCVARGGTEVEALENLRATIRAGLAITRFLEDDPATVELEINA